MPSAHVSPVGHAASDAIVPFTQAATPLPTQTVPFTWFAHTFATHAPRKHCYPPFIMLNKICLDLEDSGRTRYFYLDKNPALRTMTIGDILPDDLRDKPVIIRAKNSQKDQLLYLPLHPNTPLAALLNEPRTHALILHVVV
ncbi:hypothetical protein HK101_000881 [Irineochytrium annulatum]|nr:hypothetical protein HK101_000881 [Irineochytrium annulatum]